MLDAHTSWPVPSFCRSWFALPCAVGRVNEYEDPFGLLAIFTVFAFVVFPNHASMSVLSCSV